MSEVEDDCWRVHSFLVALENSPSWKEERDLMPDLAPALRRILSRLAGGTGSGELCPVHVNEEGDTYTAEQLAALLRGRDEFLVSKGLFSEFAHQLDAAAPSPPPPAAGWTEEQVERAAIAFWAVRAKFYDVPDLWDELTPHNQASCKAAMRAALSTLAPPPSGWQPIESAPRDGTRVLLWTVHANAAYAKDDDDRWAGAQIGRWTDFNGGGWEWHGMIGQHTHWQPLPPPPSGRE